MNLYQFFTKGSGTNGQGPGRVGSMILDKAGVMIEVPESHPMKDMLMSFKGVEYVGVREIADEEAVTEPEISPEDKRQGTLDDIRVKLEDKRVASMAVIRSIAGETAFSKASRVDMIESIMDRLDKNDAEVLARAQEAFDA